VVWCVYQSLFFIFYLRKLWYSSTFHAGGKDEPGKYHCTKGGFISGIDQFDHLEFGISAKEAGNFDPAIRLTLEAAQAVRFPCFWFS
jgi:acyl transferase domain-containing protein